MLVSFASPLEHQILFITYLFLIAMNSTFFIFVQDCQSQVFHIMFLRDYFHNLIVQALNFMINSLVYYFMA